MTRRALCMLAVALLLASLPACGKYGPPKRRLLETPANAASAAPSANAGAPAGESCEQEPGTPPQPEPATPEQKQPEKPATSP